MFMSGPVVLKYDTRGGGLGSEHAHEVQVELGRVVVPEVTHWVLPAVPVLLPGGDPVLGLDVPQRVVVWTDVVRTAKHLSDDEALLRQCHKAVPEGHHLHDRGVDVLNVQEVSWEGTKHKHSATETPWFTVKPELLGSVTETPLIYRETDRKHCPEHKLQSGHVWKCPSLMWWSYSNTLLLLLSGQFLYWTRDERRGFVVKAQY